MNWAGIIGFLISLGLLAGVQDTLPDVSTEIPEAEVVQVNSAEVTREEEIAPGVEIHSGLSIRVNGTDYRVNLNDGKHTTGKQLHPNDRIDIESAEPMGSVYLEWNTAPQPYVLRWDGGEMVCGRNGFLHEYIPLPEAVTGVSIVCETENALCDVRLFTPGSAPDDVQVWLPPCQEADILVFPTHSDDDTLFFGTLISYYTIERQMTVQTAFMVDHRNPIRDHERLDGLWEMGVRHYPVLGTAPDTDLTKRPDVMAFYSHSNIEGWQVEQIRRFRPLVVVGHDLDGEYGNGGHKVNAYYLTLAVESAANPDLFPESARHYGVWDTPKLYLHLYADNEIIMEVNESMTRDPEGRTPFQVAEDAYKWHVSQQKLTYRVYQGSNPRYDCRRFGLYRTLVGFDTSNDVMENICEEMFRAMPSSVVADCIP